MRSISRVRQESMWILRVVLEMTLKDVATALRRRDHTTIMWGVAKVWDRAKKQPEYEAELRAMVPAKARAA